jgi:hypothetical protein
MKHSKFLAYSVERIAYSQKLSAKRYPLNAKILRLLICSFTFCVLYFNFNCFAQPISSAELINNAKLYDGKTVTYEGEVIGEVMVRGEYAWINVNDGQNAVGIWVNKNLTQDILYAGNYKFKGDGLEITGIFHRACPEHGGDLDIHAQGLRKIRPGRQTLEKLNLGKRNLALVLLGVLCLVWILRQLKIK